MHVLDESRIAWTPLFEAASSSMRSKKVPAGDRQAVLTLTARFAVDAEVQTVERLGEDARRSGLAGPALVREEVGVTDPVFLHRVASAIDT